MGKPKHSDELKEIRYVDSRKLAFREIPSRNEISLNASFLESTYLIS